MTAESELKSVGKDGSRWATGVIGKMVLCGALKVAVGLGTARPKSSLRTVRCGLKAEQSSGCQEGCE